jgi:tetratricopeptide (TPR) repeat protein
MNKICLIVFVILIAAVSNNGIALDEQHQHSMASDTEKIGTVHFPVSCSDSARSKFNHAVALLHSFWYQAAANEFTEVTVVDPDCAMGYWGVAMSYYHPLWEPPNPVELQKGAAAAQKASSMSTKTEREKDYLGAIVTFYKESDKLDHRTRAIAYSQAMERIYEKYPDDNEAAVFYALTLNSIALPTDKTYANQKKAVTILEKVLEKEPEHPGVYHYIIHDYDYPALAKLALPAARMYAKVAPAAPHALHMPSHIFTRLGLWDESIASNIASAAAAKAYVQKTMPGAGSYDQLHAMDYLAYAYLQKGQDQKAKGVLEESQQITKLDQQQFAAAYAFGAIPARYAVERHQWSEAMKIEVHPAEFPWGKFPYAEALFYFARGVGGARSGKVEFAQDQIAKLETIEKNLLQAKDQYWADNVEIQRRETQAWLLKAQGKNSEAVDLLRSAAELEGSTEKHPVTPGAVIPAYELLGEMLLELERPQEAIKAFETSLASAPNRFNGLYGAARSCEIAGDQAKARDYYAQLLKLASQSDGTRDELSKAKGFLAQKY